MTPPEGVHEGLFNSAYQPPTAGIVNIDPISAAAWQITILAINLKMFFLFIILFFGAPSDCFGSVFNNLILIFFAFFINFSAIVRDIPYGIGEIKVFAGRRLIPRAKCYIYT